MSFNPDFLNAHDDEEQENALLEYLQEQSPEVLARVAKSISPEIKDIISQNVRGLMGALPSEQFKVQISTDSDNMSGLLASAMMTGYFLRQMEQRMELEAHLNTSDPSDSSGEDTSNNEQ
jgi:uncharacterized Zn finger protein